jgi:molybdopterin synthase catalytic subunit
MKLSITVTHQAISEDTPFTARDDCGALAEFRGVVRGEEKAERIEALEYEAYQPMAEQEMERIVRELAKDFPCAEVKIVHRIGTVPVGETSILVRVAARHRAEAFGLLTGFLDRLKEDVPIWKVAPVKSGASL